MATDPLGLLAFRNAYDSNSIRRRQAINDPLAADADEAARNMAAAAILSASKNPDETAKANALALLTGLPPATVDDNLSAVERQVQVAKARNLMQNYPSLGVWATDPRMAAIGRDDLDSLGKTAETVKKYDGPVLRAWNGPAPTIGNLITNIGDQFSAMGAGFKSATLEGINWIQQRRSGMLGFAPWVLEDKLNPEVAVRTREALRRTAAQASADANLSYPNIQNETGKLAYGAFTSIVQNLPGLAASILTENPAPAVAYAGLSQGSQSYGKYLARGATPEQALAGGALEGGIESITEMIPMGYLVSAFGKREIKGFLGEMGKELLTEIPGEQLATFGQDAVDTAIANPDKTWGQFWSERGVAAGETLGVTILQSLMMGGAGLGVHRLVNSQRSAQAEYDGEFLNQLAGNAAESLTRKRDPSSWAKFLHLQTEGTPVEKLYIPAEAVASLYQSNNTDWHDDGGWFSFDKSIPQQIDQGLRTGGDVIVNTADYVAHLAGTPAWDALADHVRGRADGLSLAEARSYEDAHADEMEARGREAARQAMEQMNALSPVARVYQEIFDKARAAGFGVRPARAYAELWSSRYEARAARSTQQTDAYQAYKASNVDIIRDVPDSVKAYSKADRTDVLINAMRRDKAAPSERQRKGPSLLEFIAKRGGIEDRNGDLKALGFDKWHREGAFRRKLIAAHGPEGQGQLKGMETGSTPNSPERVFEAAIQAGYFPERIGTESEKSGYSDKADIQSLYDAMDREFRGNQPVYAEGNAAEGVTATDAEVRKAADDLRAMLESRGLDPDTATPAEIIDAINSYHGEVERGFDQPERGRLDIYANGDHVIRLFADSDLSTLLHESGHLWVEELKADAEADDASDQIKADWETVKKWFAANGHAIGEDGMIPTDAHELWARGIERYFMEGKAPSSGLRAAFDAFKGWLLRIYQVVQRLKSPVNKDVRAVMDRLIATDEAIADQANDIGDKALFTSAEQAGMTDAEFAEYQKTVSDSRDGAFDALLYRTMETIRRQRTKEWKEERSNVRENVAESIAKRPEFVALRKMRGKDGERTPLDRKAIVDEYGSDALALVPRGVPPTVVDEGGVHPDILAEAVGLSSGDDLMQRLMGIQKRENELRAVDDKRSAFNEAVDNDTDQIMRDRYGDILNDGSIEEEALAAIHSDQRSTVLASELRALARKKGEVPTPWQLAKQWAERTVNEGKVSEQASAAALAMHRRNEVKAGRAAEAAILAGDIDEAYRQKQVQLLNHARWQAAKAAKDEVDKIVRRLGKLAKAKTLASMDQDYLDRIHQLLEDYDFRPRTQRALAERESFNAWVKSREDMGEEIYIPPRLANSQQVNWSQMTYSDLTSLDDVVTSIASAGRQKKKLLVLGEERDFAELVNAAVEGAKNVPDLKVSSERNPKRSNIKRVHAELVKVESIADDMDDNNPNGVFNRVLIRGATEAANKKAQLVEDILHPISQLYLSMPKAERARHLEKVEIPEFLHPLTGEPTVFTRSQLLAIALNTGNESNLDKMLRGEGWNLATVESVLARELTENDWKFVSAVWQNIEKMWPDIARTERELTGVVPEKVKPRIVTTPYGQIEGGYYPVVYDPNNPRTPEHIRDATARDAEEFFGQHGRYVSTPKGHTITRTEAAAPLLYSVEGVLFNHVNRVATRIAYGRYIRDALKFTRNDKIRSLVRDKLGPDLQAQLEPWLRRQVNEASMNTRDLAGWEAALRQFRINATIVGLGFRFTTMQAQIAGLNNSAAYIGGDWVATGMAEAFTKWKDARSMVFEASPEMARRAQEFDRDVSAAFRQMQGKATKLDVIRSNAYWGIGWIDVNIVAVPTWLGAYRKALSEGMSETDAAAYGDKIVRISQGAGRAKDLASIQDANEGWRVATMFYSYFNALYQQQRATVKAAMRGDYRKAAHMAFYTMIAAPLMSALLTGDWDWPSENDSPSDYLGWVMSHVFFGLWGGIPFVRDAASAGQQVASGKAPTFKDALDRANNPAIRALVAGGSLMGDFYKGAHDGALPEKWLQHAIETPGYFIGLPTGQLGATADYLYALATHQQHPKGPADVVSGLEHGRRREQK